MGQLALGSSEIIATLALVASVISLLLSWRAGHHTARITTYRSATDLTLDIDHVFVEHPGLRKYFYDGQHPRDTDEDTRALVNAIAELMLDCFECIWDIRESYSRADRGSWGEYVMSMLRTSPVMSEMLDSREGWYPALADLKQAYEKGDVDVRTIRILRRVRRFWQAAAPTSELPDQSQESSSKVKGHSLNLKEHD